MCATYQRKEYGIETGCLWDRWALFEQHPESVDYLHGLGVFELLSLDSGINMNSCICVSGVRIEQNSK